MKYDRIRKLCARGKSGTKPTLQRRMTVSDRAAVLAKTGGRCHLCGGRVRKNWRVDHIVPHRLEGKASLENYLPICRECNGLRGGYRPKVMRLIIRLGIYAKQEIRDDTEVGSQILKIAYGRLRSNRKRRTKRRGGSGV